MHCAICSVTIFPVAIDRYVEGSDVVAQPQLKLLGGYNVFVRYPTACRALRCTECFLFLFIFYFVYVLVILKFTQSDTSVDAAILLIILAPIACEYAFEGGGWALVRRTTATSIWHQATDDLAGIDVYGSYGTPTSDSIFSIAWSTWQTTGEMLFMTGMREH